MSFIVSIYHILASMAVLLGGCGIILRLYTSSIKRELKTNWDKDITDTKISIERKKDNELREMKSAHSKEITDVRNTYDKEIDEMKTNYREDHDKLERYIDREVHPEAIKSKVDGQMKLVTQGIEQMKEMMMEMKQNQSNQQETLIAIQMNVTEIKPRLDHLEARVASIESKSS